MATTVRITETYDMKTSIGKLGILGIHTPSSAQIKSLYPGLIKNHKFIRFKKCDVVGACASVLPADPLQVGVTAGTVAPEDMFNPILYKAVSNEAFDNLVSRIYDSVNSAQVIDSGSVNAQDLDITDTQAFNIYYGLLAEKGRFKKSMPQTGFGMRGLIPICHTLISQYGNLKKPGLALADGIGVDAPDVAVPDNLGEVPAPNPSLGGMLSDNNAFIMTGQVFRGRSVKMPRIPLHYELEANNSTVPDVAIPKTFVGCIIMPPAKLHEFYYRMRVTWTVSFEGVISTMATGKLASISAVGSNYHGANYQYEDSKTALPSQNSTIDADNVEVNKIMES